MLLLCVFVQVHPTVLCLPSLLGMHYDYNRQRIYLTTSKMEIRQLNLSLSSGLPNLNVTVLNDQVLFNRTGTLTNIAVDWINDELYWVESNPQGACQVSLQ